MTSKNIPELRFPGFEGEWEMSRFGDRIYRGTEKYNPERDHQELPCIELESLSQDTGILLQTFNSQELKSIKNKFHKGDILFGKLRPYLRKFYRASFNGVCSSEIWVLKGHTTYSDFIYYLIQTEKFNYEVNLTVGSKMPRAEWSYISEIDFSFPLLPEQQKIATFLSSLDQRIQLLTRKKEQLEQYKKGIMQQIFSRQLRFRDDQGKEYPEWEEKYLGELCEIVTGNKDTQNKVFDGTYPFFVRSDNVERINSYSYDGEAILTSGDGVGVGRNFHYINGKFDFHQRVYCLRRFNENTLAKYLFYFFSEKFYQRVKKMSAKNSVDSVRMDMISKMNLFMPCKPEQQKIASFLSSVDDKITRVNTQIEQTRKWKQGLLQKMFV